MPMIRFTVEVKGNDGNTRTFRMFHSNNHKQQTELAARNHRLATLDAFLEHQNDRKETA